MPHTKSAKKRLRQSIKRKIKNQKVKKEIKELIKQTKKLADTKTEQDKILKILKLSIKKIDKAVSNKVLKKNTGARKKSRLISYVQKALNKKIQI